MSWVLFEDYFRHLYSPEIFIPVNPTPEWETRRAYYELIRHLRWVGPAYAVVGGWVFSRRGCLTILAAATFAAGPELIWSANVLGRL